MRGIKITQSKKTTMKQVLFTLLFLCSNAILFAQNGVGINTDNSDPDASAILDVKSTTQGMLVPRMTTAQKGAIATPATGLMIFQTDGTTGFYYYNGSAWTLIGGSPADLADNDNDTKVQVEETADEDKIRFDLGGTEA